MRCSFCGSELERPGDLCLVCGEGDVEAAAVLAEGEEAEVRFYGDEEELARETVPAFYGGEDDERARETALRNFASLVGDLVYRRRPEKIFYRGSREVLERFRPYLTVEVKRVGGDDFFEEVEERVAGREALERVEVRPDAKMGGSHTTVVGENEGRRRLMEAAGNPWVKKIIPAAISAKGNRGGGGVELKVTRVDRQGNLKALLKEGASVQEIRIVTTASSAREGRMVAESVREGIENG